MIRRDKAATQMAGFLDKRSYISFRIHPGTQHACIFLKGKDVEVMRRLVFQREQGHCQVCRAYYGWNYGEMDHIVGGRGPQRCWCAENLRWLCPEHHRARHVLVRWKENAA